MRREAGRRAIAQARDRRREQSRRIGWRYIPGIAVYCLVASALIVYMAWTMGSGAAWFMCGAAVGASLLLLWIVVDSVEATRLEMGGYAEQFTEDELRKLRRAGWRVTSNIPFDNCDVDHVAIGPAGVVVLETKWTSGALFTERGQLTSHGKAALDQVERNAEKIRRVLEQGGYARGVDGCMVVVWGKKVPGCPFRVPGRRGSMIDGDQLGEFLSSKPTRLTPSDIDEAAAALDSWLGPRREHIAAEAKRKLVRS
jgi:hypothetical protein